jgi:outer membrane receptor protein involved in Fe transport
VGGANSSTDFLSFRGHYFGKGNNNGRLDVVGDAGYTPFPFWADRDGDGRVDLGEFRSPLSPDLEYVVDQLGRATGAYPVDYRDSRRRFTLREDLSWYVADFFGTHDIKLGAVLENEGFEGNTLHRPQVSIPSTFSSAGNDTQSPSPFPQRGRVSAFLWYPANLNNHATGDNLGFYVQDTYKPLRNLTLGIGLRYDFEGLDTRGFTHFDPAAERRVYDGLMEVSGLDVDPFDAYDTYGLCGDPLVRCSAGTPNEGRLAVVFSDLRALAPRHLSRHQSVVDVSSPFLRSILGRDVTNEDLLGAGVNARLPEPIRITNSNLAPRLSLAWDPAADGKTKVFASWGRYFDKLFLASVVWEQGPDFLSRYYQFDADGVDAAGAPNHQMGDIITQSPLSAYQVDRGLRTPFSDEWTAGIERELAPEFSVSLTYIRRNYRDQLQDVDLNHYTRVDPNTGELMDTTGLADCGGLFGTRTSCIWANDGLPDLFIHNFFLNRVFHLGNTNEQTYRGWELEFVRRLSRKWQMQASYTFSKAYGDAETYDSTIGDDASLTEYEPGYLNYDQRHVIKLNAIAYLPGDWRLGGAAQWSSGLPWSKVFEATSLDDAGYLLNRDLFGYIQRFNTGLVRENRNIHRNPAVYRFDVRLEKNFVIGRSSAAAFFEVYNLLNSNPIRVREERTYIVRSVLGGDPYPWTVLNGEREFGRRFQVGLRVDF